MRKDHLLYPTSQSIIGLLKACIKQKNLKAGVAIHAEVARLDFMVKDIFVGNTVLDMHVKCGSFAIAKQVFDELPSKNEVSWNVLLSGLVDHGLDDGALELYQQMHLQSISPNVITFLCSLKACGRLGSACEGLELHSEVERRGFLERHVSVGSALVDMYAKCGWLKKAEEVFSILSTKNIVSWTSLIAGYVEHGCGDEALMCFEQMESEGILPDAVTYVWALKGCSSICAKNKCVELHSEIERRGLSKGNAHLNCVLIDVYISCSLITNAEEALAVLPARNVASWNAVISGYTENGFFEKVLECLDQMRLEGVSPDAVTYLCCLKACGQLENLNKAEAIHAEIDRIGLLEKDLIVASTLVDMYAKIGLLSKAQEVFDRLPDRDIVTWNTLILAYAEAGQGEDALVLFEQMQTEGLNADIASLISIMKACGNIGAMDVGQMLHGEVERKGLLEWEIVVGNALVDMYAKWGWLTSAQIVFDNLPQKDVISWNSLLAGYSHLGETESVSGVFEKMYQENIRPDAVTFLIVLNSCSRTCLWKSSQTYFTSMSRDHGIVPAYEHYSCLVDLLGRAGQLEIIFRTLEKMPMSPDISLWHSVLDACMKSGNLKLGMQAFQHALSTNKYDTAAFILMSHISLEM
ncbi:hypothetical protein KP509_33G068000 [Ceratopteris richardii]|nr:hypothetical protein KP509_33G068000 [Ceratopteris richardii]